MVSVRKRGKVYEYRFEIVTIDGARKWVTKSEISKKADTLQEGAKAYNDFMYNGRKVICQWLVAIGTIVSFYL